MNLAQIGSSNGKPHYGRSIRRAAGTSTAGSCSGAVSQGLEGARARYVADLLRARPHFEEQVSDVVLVLHLLVSEASPPVVGPLAAARAEYVARLRDCYRSLDEQVLELAKAGAHLFAPALGLSAPANP